MSELNLPIWNTKVPHICPGIPKMLNYVLPLMTPKYLEPMQNGETVYFLGNGKTKSRAVLKEGCITVEDLEANAVLATIDVAKITSVFDKVCAALEARRKVDGKEKA